MKPYTKGHVNKAIDLLLHPWFQRYPAIIIVDGIAHACIEDAHTKLQTRLFESRERPHLSSECRKITFY